NKKSISRSGCRYIIYDYIFYGTAINGLKGKCGAEGVENRYILNPNIPEATYGCRTKFYGTGTGSNGTISDIYVVVKETFCMGFETYSVIGSVYVTVRNPHIFTITDIHTIIVPVGIAIHPNPVYDQICTPIIGLNPTGRIFQCNT